ncbi:MAG: hypothetical protein BGN91_14925 [Nitrobacter sp. 62-13]|jgi:hypothetical protein|uniref:hypothetical protein n=1 Tax=Nitrobacter sp. 62-13 TaxID=1895797 RepID=UPI000965AD8C|nr:hypothetical protein [Nitrobacter sp. 62-13]OJU30632.1 MAG: hypothetical protein BGN91_14925 [Nitrobacter sp. 62-13]
MTLLSSVPRRSREFDKLRRAHLAPLLASALIAAIAMTLVAWLLWPTWAPKTFDNNERLPVSIGETLFNIPPHAFRRKVQRHSGPQESVDLNFIYPSLATPGAPRRVTAETIDETPQPIDRIFLSIAAHHDTLAPDVRLRTIYPRYLDEARTQSQDGLSISAFRERTPYAGEDLFVAETPALVARCTRDAATPGMCLSERRVGGADLTFRFPRQWLTEWRDVAGAMERLAQQLHGSHN